MSRRWGVSAETPSCTWGPRVPTVATAPGFLPSSSSPSLPALLPSVSSGTTLAPSRSLGGGGGSRANFLDASPWVLIHPGQAWRSADGQGHPRALQPGLSPGVARGGVSPGRAGEKTPELADQAPADGRGWAGLWRVLGKQVGSRGWWAPLTLSRSRQQQGGSPASDPNLTHQQISSCWNTCWDQRTRSSLGYCLRTRGLGRRLREVKPLTKSTQLHLMASGSEPSLTTELGLWPLLGQEEAVGLLCVCGGGRL